MEELTVGTGSTFGPPAHMGAFTDVDERWGPLAKLAGQWASDQGRDFSYSYSEKADTENLYREEITFDPFGPVDNGSQQLFALDYRMKAWRLGADDFFHMEVGYWQWEPATNTILRCFMVPRTTTMIASGTSEADANAFSLHAKLGSETNGVLQNAYLHGGAAKTVAYDLEIDLSGGNFSYKEDTVLEMSAHGGGTMHHTDANTLQKV